MLASIPADVSKRLVIISCAAALIAAACSNPPAATIQYGSGTTFVPFVADNVGDSDLKNQFNTGLGNAVAVDKDGVPYISYWIFPAALGPDDIAGIRPIGAPYVTTNATATQPSQDGGAVGIASVSADGTWTRGAAAQVQDTPQGIYVPYGPATVDALIGATAKNTNGTDIAIDANGGKHVVWTGPDGVWYAEEGDTFAATQIYDWPRLNQAGPVGRPSIAVTADGVPWVAFGIDTSADQEIRLATRTNDSWSTEVVASIPHCGGCPPPGPAQVGITPSGPIVVYVDGSTGELKAASQNGSSWTSQTIHPGAAASAPSLAIDKNGLPNVAYSTSDAIYVATPSGTGWADVKVADAEPVAGTANQAGTTGVAVDDSGATYVTWYDKASGSVQLAKSDDGQIYAPVETRGTSGGAFPSLAVAADGSRVFLAWYTTGSQNLLMGIVGSVDDLLLAQPSPTPTSIPSQGGTCSPTGSLALTIIASGTTFDVNCLAVTPGDKFSVTLDNQDSVAHDFSIYPSSSDVSPDSALFYSLTDPNPGQTSTKYSVGALDPGTYWFQCDFHPTVMTGTFIVAKK